jgi:hypothetical protein
LSEEKKKELSKEVGIDRPIIWKIRVKRGGIEVEVVGMNPEMTKKLFDEIAKKYNL